MHLLLFIRFEVAFRLFHVCLYTNILIVVVVVVMVRMMAAKAVVVMVLLLHSLLILYIYVVMNMSFDCGLANWFSALLDMRVFVVLHQKANYIKWMENTYAQHFCALSPQFSLRFYKIRNLLAFACAKELQFVTELHYIYLFNVLQTIRR